MRTGHCALAVALSLIIGAALAQARQSASGTQAAPSTQQDSLAAAARRAREQKKNQTKAPKVYTNDNLPTTGTINVVGSDESANSNQTAAAPSPRTADAASTTKADSASLSAALAAAKGKLASAQKDLDLAQRKYALDQQTFISNPNHDHDYSGEEALKNEQTQITDAQDAVAAAQKEVDDLQAKLAEAGKSAQ